MNRMGIRASMEKDVTTNVETDDYHDVNGAFAGRTIRHVDTSNINQWTFTFTDGEQLSIDTINKGAFYGPVLVLK